MRIAYLLLPALFLLANATGGLAQTNAPVPPGPAAPAAAPSRLLLKVGLNAGRTLQWGSYYGLSARLPLSLGAEYLLNPKFTLYGQLDADFGLSRREAYFGDRNLVAPTGAAGIGARYYYNQAGRARHNRVHGPFVGNYLALEARTELRRRALGLSDRYTPGLNAVWGMQRRLSRNFCLISTRAWAWGPPEMNSV